MFLDLNLSSQLWDCILVYWWQQKVYLDMEKLPKTLDSKKSSCFFQGIWENSPYLLKSSNNTRISNITRKRGHRCIKIPYSRSSQRSCSLWWEIEPLEVFMMIKSDSFGCLIDTNYFYLLIMKELWCWKLFVDRVLPLNTLHHQGTITAFKEMIKLIQSFYWLKVSTFYPLTKKISNFSYI